MLHQHEHEYQYRHQCKIIGISNNILTLETGYSEPIKIKFDSVRQISSTEPVEIHLTNGEVLKGRITTEKSGKVLVNGESGRGDVAVEMANIAALNPPPKKPVTWKGNITLGGNLQMMRQAQKGEFRSNPRCTFIRV